MKHNTPPPPGEAERRVSLHAVTRYCQRVIGVTLPEADTPLETALQHAEAAGLSIEFIRALIYCPQVAAGIRIGVPMVRTPDFQAKLSTSGVVVTVIPNNRRRKMKRLTKREHLQRSKARNRRMKRRPRS